jgi:virginiamycin B lyase
VARRTEPPHQPRLRTPPAHPARSRSLSTRVVLAAILAAPVAFGPALSCAAAEYTMQSFPLPQGVMAYDVMPAADGSVWFTVEAKSALGRLDPKSGAVELIPLGSGSAPHGLVVGPDGAVWIADGGLNAILRVDPASRAKKIFALPDERTGAALNGVTFDPNGALWFTGESGVYGVLDPHTGGMRVFEAPQGAGPDGIATLPAGDVFYASFAGNYLGRIDPETGSVRAIEPPTPHQGARRVATDSKGGVWVSEWNGAAIARYDSKGDGWQSWKIPGDQGTPYAIYVDESDAVWISDWNANAIWRFDAAQGVFAKFALPRAGAEIRQMAGRKGEVWAAESGTGYLSVIRFAGAGASP